MRGTRVVVVVAGIAAAAVLACAPAQASPSNPCLSAPLLVCQFVPIFPDLDHDIDLTQNPDGTPVSLLPEAGDPDPAVPPPN